MIVYIFTIDGIRRIIKGDLVKLYSSSHLVYGGQFRRTFEIKMNTAQLA